MEDDRVVHLEMTVAMLQARDIETKNKFDHLMASIALLVSSKTELTVPVNQDVLPSTIADPPSRA
jgi:hypothetical protein